MKPQNLSLGSFCISLSGHDAGRTYLIVKVVDPEFVLVCDGVYRKVENPKRKRAKHLKYTGWRADERLLQQILDGVVNDNEIYRALLNRNQE